MTMLVLQRVAARVRVESDPSTEDWVQWRSQHFFEVHDLAGSRATWRVVRARDQVRPATNDGADSDTGCLRVSAAQHLVAVDAPPGPWHALWTLRAARHVLRWTLLAQMPALYFHGAALADRRTGLGLCVLGPSQAGKSMLSYMLLGQGFDWISQDDLCLVAREGQHWSVLGWPGSLRLRRGAIKHFAELTAPKIRFSHPANAVRSTSPQARLHLYPEELAALRGCGIRGEAPVAGFLVLDPRLEDETPQSMRTSALRDALFAAWDILPERRAGTRIADALRGAVDWREIVFNSALLDYFGLPDLDVLGARIEQLAAATPGWRIGRSTPISGPFALLLFEKPT